MRLRLSVLALLVVAVTAFAASAVGAETFEPTRKDDPVPNGCKPNNCSLREAVVAANSRSGKDTIKLRGGSPYRLEIPAGGMTGEALHGDLDVQGTTTVTGAGVSRTLVDAEEKGRAFDLGGRVTLRRMTITDGSASSGGGVSVGFRPARLDRLLITQNKAGDGGGVRTQSLDLVITRTTIAGNFADGGSGGGLASTAGEQSPRTRLLRSAVIGNGSSSIGGGIWLGGVPDTSGTAPVLDAVNSTIANNGSALNGGGISATFGGAEANLDNVTLAENRADADENDSGEGGGMHEFAGEINSFDSIVADNGAPEESDPGAQCLGDFVGSASLLQNQLAPADGCFVTGFIGTDDAMLGPLADNGGPTPTKALLDGSPAIGLAEECPKADQRGRERPRTGCDAGAFERRGP
jgi:CSLREA domain-containing protein